MVPKGLVVVPTTTGPVQVLGLAKEDLALRRSTVCINLTPKPAGIDAAYNEFVNAPGGLIEKLFGHNRFRIDVSGAIDAGDSWQLAFLLAHALAAAGRLATRNEDADLLVWATGAVRADLAVTQVGEVAQKLRLSEDLLRNSVGDIKAHIFVPEGNAEAFAERRKLGTIDGHPNIAWRALKQANEAIELLGLPPLRSLAAAQTPVWMGNPYKGLAQFDFEDQAIFHGRTKARADALKTLLENSDRKGISFLLMLGASGSGKSSLARAGVTQDLQRARIGSWSQICVRADLLGDAPLETLLTVTIGNEGNFSSFAPHAGTEEIRNWIAARAEHWLRATDRQIVLVLDQLESLFSGSYAHADVDLIGVAISTLAKTGRIWIIATLRSDLYHLLEQCHPLFELCQMTQSFAVSGFRPFEIREIIREPALRAGLSFEIQNPVDPMDPRSLADRIEDDAVALVGGGVGLLEFALSHLYERRRADGNLLTHLAYDSMGRLSGAIAFHAESALKVALSKHENRIELEEALNALLIKLVRISPDALRAGHAVAAKAMSRGYPRAVPTSEAEHALIDAFLDARLLVADESGETVVLRLAHDTLIENWDRIRALVDRRRQAIALRDRLAITAAEWSSTKDEGLLLGAGATLAEADQLCKDWPAAVEPDLAAFVLASVDRESARLESLRRAREEELERDKRHAERTKRANVRLRALAVCLAAATAAAGGLAILADRARDLAEVQRARAEASTDFLVDTFEAAIPGEENPNSLTAVTVLKRGAERIGKEFSNQADIRVRLLDSIARAFNHLGSIDEAKALLESNLEALKRTGAGGAGGLLTLSQAYRRGGHLKEALAIAHEAMEQMDSDRTTSDDLRGLGYETLALLNRDLGDLAESVRNFDLAEMNYRKARSANSLDVARVLNNKAFAFTDLGEYSRAETALLQANEIYRNAFDGESMFLGQNFFALALNAHNSGNNASAEDYAGRAESILVKVLNPDTLIFGDLRTLQGQIALSVGNRTEAKRYLKLSVDIYSSYYKKPHYLIGISQYYLAYIENEDGDFGAALEYIAAAKANYDSAYNAGHVNQGDLLVLKSVILRRAGRAVEAEVACAAGLRIIEEAEGTESDFYRESRSQCGG